MAQMIALGIDSTGQAIPIRLTAAGKLSISGGSGPINGPGPYKGNSFVLMGIDPTGQITPIQVDSNGNVQSGGGSGGSGTVTSVDMTVPTIFTIAGNPITTSGTLALTLANQSPNVVFAGPTSGGAVAPTFRALVGADLPATITKSTTFNIAGVASVPALIVSGAPFAGTGTTSFPQVYINDSAATASTTLSTAGTSFGINGHGTSDRINVMTDGVSVFLVSSGGGATATQFRISAHDSGLSNSGGHFLLQSQGNASALLDANLIVLRSDHRFAWCSTTNILGTPADLILVRDAANTLAQRNGATAQLFRVYNTYTDASNYEFAGIYWVSNVVNFGTVKAGTGAGRVVQIGSNLAGNPDSALNIQGLPIRFFSVSSGAKTWEMANDGGLVANGNANFYHGTSALATTATDRFLCVNSCAGVPTGVPVPPTGQIPLVFDSTNSKLMAYIGGAWKGVVLA